MLTYTLIGIVHVILSVVALGLSVLVFVLLVEVIASFAWFQRKPGVNVSPSSTFAVVIPAHDEAGTIEHTLAAVLDQIGGPGHVLVVADNCTDDTAAVASAAGVEVIVRQEPDRRGKGYALGFAVRHLTERMPQVVVFLDADCIPAAGAIEHLVSACERFQRPIQARYELVAPPRNAGPLARVGAFAWRVKNVVRPTGLANLGLPCQLMGSGMAFPSSAMDRIDLETGHLVEDMVFGLDLAAAGMAPRFLPGASVQSELPPTSEGQTAQRTRWETGHLRVIAGLLPRLVSQAVLKRNIHLFALALDAAVPPLALMSLLLMGMVVLSGLMALVGGPPFALLMTLAAGIAATVAVAAAWLIAGKDLLSAGELFMLPGYVAAKIPLYVRALSGSKIPWVRSKRQ